MSRPRLSIALRLTLWYVAAFSLTSLLAMAIVYSTVGRALRAEADEELRQDLHETASLLESGGVAAFREEMAVDLAAPDSARVFQRLWSAAGEPVAAAGFDPPDARTRAAVAAQTRRAEPALRSVTLPRLEHPVRVGYIRAAHDFVLEQGVSLEDVEADLHALRSGIAIALPAFLLLGAPMGWFMARRALRGVEVVTRTAMDIADGAMGRRVPVGTRADELDRLAEAFNRMLDRIGGLIGGMREVTDNLAHDLRTPLTRMRSAAEHVASRDVKREEWLAFAGTTTEECDRMLQILDHTLEIAEAEAGAARLRLERVDLAALVGEARDLFTTLAEDADITLERAVPDACIVRADRSRVQRIVANLLDNALKYTPRGGRVTIALANEPGWARLEVRDTGVGVPADELPRIFERFYRGDGSRSGQGSGLGLSLARAFARAHGGDLTAVSTPGTGSIFTLRLKRDA